MSQFTELIDEQKGATVLEYAFIASLISIAAVGAMTLLGDAVNALIESAASVFS